jgi:hypothetical protein
VALATNEEAVDGYREEARLASLALTAKFGN